MSDHRLELADVFRIHEEDFLARWGDVLSPQQRKAFADVRDCRTAVLGGHVRQYDCGHRVILYNSCGNRSCPQCQASARAQWLAEREAELLPVDAYFHVVFTLPQEIAHLALQNAREIYRILFRATSETLLKIAADPKHLGAEIGFLAVLHTWGQNISRLARVTRSRTIGAGASTTTWPSRPGGRLPGSRGRRGRSTRCSVAVWTMGNRGHAVYGNNPGPCRSSVPNPLTSSNPVRANVPVGDYTLTWIVSEWPTSRA